MARVVIAGAPGVGKTALLEELSRLGHRIVSDSAREVIRERKAAGLAPRPDPLEFARQMLKRDVEKYRAVADQPGWVFFERCGLEAAAMIREASPREASPQESSNPRFTFHELVFVLPPWREIYVTDAERDHSFEHALHVHTQVVRFYAALGHKLYEVPRGTPAQRAGHVLRLLGASAA